MTPWAEGRSAHLGLLAGLVVAGLVWAVTVWGLVPGGTVKEYIAGAKAAVLYGASWVQYLVDGGTVGALLDQAQPAPLVVAVVSAVAGLVVLFCGLGVATLSGRAKLYGQSRWARWGDTKKMKLRGKLGPVVGRFKTGLLGGSSLLIASEPRHSLALASTRSGKTAGFIIPTILTWQGSQIILDIKGQLEAGCGAALRRRGKTYTVRWSDPASPDCWNPVALQLLPDDLVELERHCDRVAASFFDPVKATGPEKHWTEAAFKHFSSLLLFECLEGRREGREPSIAKVFDLVADPKAAAGGGFGGAGADEDDETPPIVAALGKVAATADVRGYPVRIVQDMTTFAGCSERERSAHVSTLLNGLQIFRSAAVRAATATCSFTWEDLRRERAAVFIQYPLKDASAYGKLTALFLDTFMVWAVDAEPKKTDQPINVVADEFRLLPPLANLDAYLAAAAGRRCVITFAIQDLADLEKNYDARTAEALLTNLDYLVCFLQNNNRTQEMLSKKIGQHSVHKVSKARGWSKAGEGSSSEAGFNLVHPSEWGDLPAGRHVVLVKGHNTRPVFCRTPFYFTERRFRKLMPEGFRT